MTNQKENFWLVLVLLGAGFIMMFGFVFVILMSLSGIESELTEEDGIGVIEITGPIEGSKKTLKDLRKFEQDENIKSILVRVDSPGGAVAPSQEIYSELLRLRDIKPVVVSMGSLAASGGYYISVGGEYIFANPGTITGSIGVIMQTTYLMELMKAIKVTPRTYKSGEHKDILSPFRESTESDDKIINTMISDVYEQFLDDISKARKLDKETIRPIADGRILTGKQALDLKLVDQLGSFNDAVRYLAEKSDLGDEPKLIYPRKETMTYIEQMFESSLKGIFSGIESKAQTAIEMKMEN